MLGAMETSICSGCGKAVSGADILYTADANVVCPECSAKDDIVATDKRAARNIQSAAVSSLLAGLLSVFFNPIFAPMVIAFASGGYALKSLMPGNERFTKHLSKGAQTAVWIFACLGIAAAAFRVLIELAVIKFMLT
jgi:DNA-directed RNA polymerase subunit RPC12/RpoP